MINTHAWYRTEQFSKHPDNSYNCLYIAGKIVSGHMPPAYHVMVRDNEITQVMNSQVLISENMDDTWFPLQDDHIVSRIEEYIDLIHAKNLLEEKEGRKMIICIKDGKLHIY